MRVIETSSHQIKRITQVYPRFLQVPRSQEILVEYMADRFLLEIFVETVEKLREVMLSEIPLETSLQGWLVEDGYLTRMVTDNVLESYPLAQENNYVERKLPPNVAALNGIVC